MTATLPTPTTTDPTSCPAWCDQRSCEWNEHRDHGFRFHEGRVADLEAELATIDGPVHFEAGVAISTKDRVELDWNALLMRYQEGEPTIQFSIASRSSAGTILESMHHLTVPVVEQIIAMLGNAIEAHRAASAGEEPVVPE